MEQIRELTRDDISQIADLHQRLRFKSMQTSSEQLRGYYQDVFLDSPWCVPELPSLVCCNSDDKIVGFIGVLARRMVYEKKPIQIAVAHRFMVDSQQATPFAAMRLMRRFLSGPQDLSLSDGANDQGRQFWEGSGGITCWLYSMNWVKIFRPASYGLYLGLKSSPRLGAALAPVANVSSRCCKAFINLLKKSSLSSHFITHEMTLDDLFGCLSQLSLPYCLHPVYEKKELEWMWTFLKNNRHRGILKGTVFCLPSGQFCGCCLYYIKPEKKVEVLLLASRKDSRNKVFQQQMEMFRGQNMVSVTGRMEPLYLPALWDNSCIVKRGSWALIHSRDKQLLETIHSGNAFISCLEGELWLRSPQDRL